MVTKETKIELTDKINRLFIIISLLTGSAIAISIERAWYVALLCYFIGGLIGHLLRPYNKNGNHRY